MRRFEIKSIDSLGGNCGQQASAIAAAPQGVGFLQSFLISALVHCIVIFNAAVWPFHQTLIQTADVRFAKGHTNQADEVRLSMTPAAVIPEQTEAQPQAIAESSREVEQPRKTAVEATLPYEPMEPSIGSLSRADSQLLHDPPAEAFRPIPPVLPATTPSPRVPSPQPLHPITKAESEAESSRVHEAARVALDPKLEPIEVKLPAPVPATPRTSMALHLDSRPSAASAQTPARSATDTTTSVAATAGITEGVVAELVKPEYPRFSIRAGEEGLLWLEIEVLADGKVGFVRVIESPGFPRLEQAAIDAIRRSRFTPAHVNGKPVREVIRKSMSFRLNDI